MIARDRSVCFIQFGCHNFCSVLASLNFLQTLDHAPSWYLTQPHIHRKVFIRHHIFLRYVIFRNLWLFPVEFLIIALEAVQNLVAIEELLIYLIQSLFPCSVRISPNIFLFLFGAKRGDYVFLLLTTALPIEVVYQDGQAHSQETSHL